MLFGRALEKANALKLLSMQLTPRDEQHANGRTYPNLFDAHPPFQIDGNFPPAQALRKCCCLRKSEVRILHALPKAWESGHVKGLRTVGGYEAEIIWADGRLVKAVFKSVVENPAPIMLRYLNHALRFLLKQTIQPYFPQKTLNNYCGLIWQAAFVIHEEKIR